MSETVLEPVAEVGDMEVGEDAQPTEPEASLHVTDPEAVLTGMDPRLSRLALTAAEDLVKPAFNSSL